MRNMANMRNRVADPVHFWPDPVQNFKTETAPVQDKLLFYKICFCHLIIQVTNIKNKKNSTYTCGGSGFEKPACTVVTCNSYKIKGGHIFCSTKLSIKKLGRIWIWIRTSCYQYRCLPVIVQLKRGFYFVLILSPDDCPENESGAGQKKPVGPQLLQSLQTLSNLRMAGSMMSGLLVAPMMKTFFLLPMPSISVRIWLMTLSLAPPASPDVPPRDLAILSSSSKKSTQGAAERAYTHTDQIKVWYG